MDISWLTRTNSRKLLASAALVGVAAGVAGLASFATFTGSATASHSVTSGTVTASLGAAGSANNRLTINATDVAAGDTIQRAVTLSNTGTLDWQSATLTTTAPTSSLLDSDLANGLQLEVDQCSVPWTESGSSPEFTYACTGATVPVLTTGPVITANQPLGAINSLTTGGTDYLRVTLTLPGTADNSFQGLTSSIDFDFTGIQRTATNR